MKSENSEHKDDEGQDGGAFRGLGMASTVGINLVATTFVGFAIGHWVLDAYLGTDPWFTIIFLLLGIAAGFRHLFRLSSRLNQDDDH